MRCLLSDRSLLTGEVYSLWLVQTGVHACMHAGTITLLSYRSSIAEVHVDSITNSKHAKQGRGPATQ